MQRQGRGHRLFVRHTPVDDVHQVTVDPILDNVLIIAEPLEHISVLLHQLLCDVGYCHLSTPGFRYRTTTIVLEQHVQVDEHPIQLDVLGHDVANQWVIECIVPTTEFHRPLSSRLTMDAR